MHNSDEARLFSSLAEKGLCSHAYIVDGDDGIGKSDFALYCARAMLCTENSKPCGHCENCKKAITGNHPDIYIVGRDKPASIADVREIIRRSGLKPNDAARQIFIVCNAGKLREESQNALLKLFEEPPESVAIFLLTESRASLLPTVLSRGQRIHLDGMRDVEIAEAVRGKYSSLPKDELENAVSLANGNLGVAEKYLSKESISLRSKAEALMCAVLAKREYDVALILLAPKYRRDQILPLITEFIKLVNEALKEKYRTANLAPKQGECALKIAVASKKSLAYMGEAAFVCMSSLENSANVKSALSRLTLDLFRATEK